MEWLPHEDDLNFVVSLLHDSFAPDSEIQRKVQQDLMAMQKHPDFIRCLLYVLKNPSSYDHQIRALCAIILKNNISVTFETLPAVLLNIVRQECLNLLCDSSKEVKRNITTLMGMLVWRGGISSWPNLVPYLCDLVESNDAQLAETSLMTLFKICEEYLTKKCDGSICAEKWQEASNTMNHLFIKFISLFNSENLAIRQNALKIVNQALQEDNGLVTSLRLDSNLYIQALFAIIDDENSEIQKLLCQSFCILVDTHNSAILPHIQNVIEYVLAIMEQEDEEVALQACEFWLALSKVDTCRDLLGNHIGRLLPLLFKQMRYSNEELDALKNYVGNDEHLDDKADDIKPFMARALVGSGCFVCEDDEYGDDGCDYERADMVGESSIGWTLRKCSAASIDALSLKFKADILPIFFPLLNQGLISGEFLVKESSILALGAIAEGCLCGLQEYMPKLIDYLLECMNSDHSLIRVITCWTLSRYMSWIMEERHPAERYFIPVMTVLLKHFLDSNKRVQHAALSAFCVFQEEARGRLVPYIDFILRAFLQCFNKFKFQSYLLLYDAIGVLSQSVGNQLNKQEYVDMLMSPLMFKFNTNTDYYDEQYMALMECLSNIVIALEAGFLPYAESVYSRCFSIISETIAYIQCYQEHPEVFEVPDRDAMCVAYDVLLGMAIGLKNYFVKFVTNSALLQNLYFTMKDESFQVRQPALALYGELVKLCFFHLSPTIHTCIPAVIENLDKTFEAVCNNAAWVIGKLCIAMGPKIEQYAAAIFQRFMYIMQTCNGVKTMYQTVAISLCTLGLVCPDVVSPHLHAFLRPCCAAMRNVADCDEKDVGFRGLCELVTKNPVAATDDFIYFCDAVASWNDIKPDLRDIIKGILINFQTQFADSSWLQFYEQLPPLLRARLEKLYGI